MKKIRKIQFSFDEKMFNVLQGLANEQGVSMADIIRDSITLYSNHNEFSKKGYRTRFVDTNDGSYYEFHFEPSNHVIKNVNNKPIEVAHN